MATRRVVIGALPTGGYGLRVSPPGVDVFTASDDQLVFSSDWATLFPIYAAGTTAVVPAGTTATVNFADLGYIPFGKAMSLEQGQSQWAGGASQGQYVSYNGAQSYDVVRFFQNKIEFRSSTAKSFSWIVHQRPS